ncbi:MAG: hypothetical protein HYY96_17970 [Candidatus Tectomicrobia bacterium]|nr:hypothetical protein [Candidatus Tectomicrobia bacterium]
MGYPQLCTLREAVTEVPQGAFIVMAGTNDMAPMALVRELVRQRKRGLRVITAPTGGLNVDLLIGAGCLASLELSAVSLGEFGAAPHFRRAAETRSLDLRDTT